jgi:hypothetical protein
MSLYRDALYEGTIRRAPLRAEEVVRTQARAAPASRITLVTSKTRAREQFVAASGRVLE